jgi:putative phosphoribosyl transferase
MADAKGAVVDQEVVMSLDRVSLEGDLGIPKDPVGVVVFAHGSGSSRMSPRNRQVARGLQSRGLATLLFDLLTPDEEFVDQKTREFRFDIGLLASRLLGATDWVSKEPELSEFAIGLFGASTGAAAALIVAAETPTLVGAVVSRGGRVDMADAAVEGVVAPTLLLVGEHDTPVLALNRRVLDKLPAAHKQLTVVEGAGHLFEEPGALDLVTELTADWFTKYLR